MTSFCYLHATFYILPKPGDSINSWMQQACWCHRVFKFSPDFLSPSHASIHDMDLVSSAIDSVSLSLLSCLHSGIITSHIQSLLSSHMVATSVPGCHENQGFCPSSLGTRTWIYEIVDSQEIHVEWRHTHPHTHELHRLTVLSLNPLLHHFYKF